MKRKKIKLIGVALGVFTCIPSPVLAMTQYDNSKEHVDYSNPIKTDTNDGEVRVLVSQASTFQVVIPKTITLNGAVNEKHEANYQIRVKGNIASNECIEVKPETEFVMKHIADKSQVLKKDITAKVNQPVTTFMIGDVKDKTHELVTEENIFTGVETVGQVAVEKLTSGNWSGVFNFKIALK